MKLADGEKLILLMLSDLHKELKINGEIEPGFIKGAILQDRLWGIEWKYPSLFSENENPPIVSEVVKLLDMWSSIESSYSNLDEQSLKNLAQATGFEKNPTFEGFDGNNEFEYVSTAKFLVDELGKFPEFKGRPFDCHHPSLDVQRRMLAAFEPYKSSRTDSLSVEKLTKILSARGA